MGRSALDGCSILVVEDEPLIAMDIQLLFERCGADVTAASTVKDALQLVDEGFSLAVLDHGLADGQSTELYQQLRKRDVPFIIHTGYEVPEDQRHGGLIVSKPAIEDDLRAAAEDLVRAKSGSVTNCI